MGQCVFGYSHPAGLWVISIAGVFLGSPLAGSDLIAAYEQKQPPCGSGKPSGPPKCPPRPSSSP